MKKFYFLLTLLFPLNNFCSFKPKSPSEVGYTQCKGSNPKNKDLNKNRVLAQSINSSGESHRKGKQTSSMQISKIIRHSCTAGVILLSSIIAECYCNR